MESMQYVLHVVNGIMFCCSLYIHTRGYREAAGCSAAEIVRRLGKNVMLAGAALSLLFILLQADWMLNTHNKAVGDGTSWAWLLFDYALAVYLMLMGTLVRVFANWRGSYRNAGRKRRATDA